MPLNFAFRRLIEGKSALADCPGSERRASIIPWASTTCVIRRRTYGTVRMSYFAS